MASAPRRLLARLRELMAHDAAPLPQLVRLVASELVSEVCSVYALRPGDILELVATEGLRGEAVGHTRLRVGEGIVGLVAATGQILNLPDAQNHPAFAYRPETGEERYASMLAVPVRRAGRTLGVLAVQNRTPRRYDADEADVLETVAMLLAEVLARVGAHDGAAEGLGGARTAPVRGHGACRWPGNRPGRAAGRAAGSAPAAGRRSGAGGGPAVPCARPCPAWPGRTPGRRPAGRRGAARNPGSLPPGRHRSGLGAQGRRGDPQRSLRRGGGGPRGG